MRYSELGEQVASRGTLSKSIRELEGEGLISRRIEETKPISSYYSLTEKGKEIARRLGEIADLLA